MPKPPMPKQPDELEPFAHFAPSPQGDLDLRVAQGFEKERLKKLQASPFARSLGSRARSTPTKEE